MKKLLIITVIVLNVASVHSQNVAKDLAYLSEKVNYKATNQAVFYNNIQKNIALQKNSNIKDDDTVNQDKSAIHDYDYYNNLYGKAKNQRNTGICLTTIGLSFDIIGFFMNGGFSNIDKSNTSNNEPITFQSISPGGYMIIAGGVLFNVGVPLWISNGIKAKNNKNARDKSSLVSFQISTKGLGVQATLHF